MSWVILNGGLGNQLFQLAAAIDQSKGAPVVLEQNLGRPRMNSMDQADISGLISGINVSLNQRKKPIVLLRKLSTLAIRESAKTRVYEAKMWVLEALASVVFSVFEIRPQRVRINCGIGFDQRFERKRNSLNVGYFQTYRWAARPDVRSELMKLTPQGPSVMLKDFARRAKSEKFLCVHVRLTDYRLENSFGIPSHRYYEEAINHSMSQNVFDKIVLFSDEPEAALNFIPEKYAHLVEKAANFPGGVLETFEAMRLCQAYVIGNSTFSWWGAFLSHNPQPMVIAPSTWFKSVPSPEELIPKEWIQFDPRFNDSQE